MEGRKVIGWNVRKLRAGKGLTLEDLAARAETEPSHLAKLERGQINATVDLLDRLAKRLGVTLADLTVEPRPGEKPPAPLRAGRRSQRPRPPGASAQPQNLPSDFEVLSEVARRTGAAGEELVRAIQSFHKTSGSSMHEIFLRLRPEARIAAEAARVINVLIGKGKRLPKGYTAESSRRKEPMAEQVRQGQEHQKHRALTRGRSPR